MTDLVEVLLEANAYHRAGQWSEAARLYQQALQADPANADAWYLLGTAQYGLGQTLDAVDCVQKAIQLNAENPNFHHALGSILVELNQFDAAIDSLRQSLAIRPESPATLEVLRQAQVSKEVSHGKRLFDANRWVEAAECFRHALEFDPSCITALVHLADALRLLRQLDQAAEIYRRLIELQSDSARSHFYLGLILKEQGDPAAAECSLRKAIEHDPRFLDAKVELGRLLTDQRKLDEAVAICRDAIAMNPQHAEAHHYLGAALAAQERLDEAVACYRQALSINPDLAKAHANLGNALCEQGRMDDAEACYRRAIELRPTSAAAHLNLGLALARQNNLQDAIPAYRRACELDPNYAEAHVSLGMAHLLLGQFAEGWPEYEWRFKLAGSQEEPMPGPRWNGEPLAGKTIFLCGEQGYGDNLQFVRYARLLKQRGAKVLVGCLQPLAALLRTSPDVDEVIVRGDVLPEFDYYSSLVTLPTLLETTLSTIPANVPYLRPDAELTSRWQNELGQDTSFKIGVVWQGNPKHQNDRHRSFRLSQLAGIARTSGVQLYSLQFGPGREQLSKVLDHWPIIDLGDRLGDFLNVASIMCNLDLTITCDSAPAHLAGALGLPVWVALPFAPDWRWLLDRTDSPWYRTMRLFRQRAWGQWNEVFDGMQQALPSIVERESIRSGFAPPNA